MAMYAIVVSSVLNVLERKYKGWLGVDLATGHWLEDCPTGLDPSFDVRPGKDYKCAICMKYGKHF